MLIRRQFKNCFLIRKGQGRQGEGRNAKIYYELLTSIEDSSFFPAWLMSACECLHEVR